jgi:hypothetical protein
MALWHGWGISQEGVEIDRRQYTGLRCTLFQNDLEAPNVIISLVGWRAEHKWHGRGAAHRLDDEIESIIAAVRYWWEEEADCDDGDAIRHLLRLHPDATDAELIALHRRYEAETLALLEDPALWSKIERVAAELVALGEISATQAHRLAGYPDPRLPAPIW